MTPVVRARAALLLSSLVVVAVCHDGVWSASPAPSVISIVHFNDAHEIEALDGGTVGGLARVATLVRTLKGRGSAHLVTFGGDLFSPSAIGTARVDGEPLAGRQAVAVMNMLGVDWMTFGNHEFDLTEPAFRARLREKTFGIVSTNVTDAAGAPFAGTVPAAIARIQAGDAAVRIGLIGLTLDANRRPWVRYRPEIPAAREQVASLRGQVDAIVAITHLSLASDIELVNSVPGIDLVLGGHEHENWILRRGRDATPIMKADSNGRSAVVATLTLPAPGQPVHVDGRIEPLAATVVPEPDVQAEIRRWMDLGFAGFRRAGFAPEALVASIPETLDGRESSVRTRPGALTDLVLAALRREVPEASVAFFNAGTIRIEDVIPPGPVRQYDVLRTMPFGGMAVGALFDGDLLEQVLDAGVANLGTGGFLQVAGAVRGPTGWTVDGVPIDPARQYRVALTDFLLTGQELRLGFLTRRHPKVREIREYRDLRFATIDELKRQFP